jgi:histidine triad (HIT) family protein
VLDGRPKALWIGRHARAEDTLPRTYGRSDCLFCKIVAGELPATRVHEDERTVAFMDINPATRGHLLVVRGPTRATCTPSNPEDLAAVAQAGQVMGARVRDRLGADGITLINSTGAAAWQTVFHFHLHVIPRYEDDPLRLPWVPGRATRRDRRRRRGASVDERAGHRRARGRAGARNSRRAAAQPVRRGGVRRVRGGPGRDRGRSAACRAHLGAGDAWYRAAST